MRSLKFFKIISLAVLLVLVSGCSISFQNDGDKKADGGVFLTQNKGKSWQHKVAILTAGGKAQSITRVSAESFAIDPNDHKAVYLGSGGSGLFYTYDINDGWHHVKSLPSSKVDAVTVDPESKCIIYASIKNVVYKSTDCSRTWKQIFLDNKDDTTINSIAVDHYDTNQVYLGTSRGDIVKSLDAGESWQTVYRADSEIDEINISPHDSRTVLAATRKDGILKTTDKGGNWVNLEENLDEFNNSDKVRDITQCISEKGLVFTATSYGLLKSPDYGDTWEKIDLLTPEKEAKINSVALNPSNCEEIFYVTNNTFYRSLDGGASWATVAIPGSRPGRHLLIDYKNPSILYLGMGSKEKQGRY